MEKGKEMASETARGIAARIWCEDKNASKEMDADLAESFAAEIDKYIDALLWCGGAADFHPGGQAHVGWQRVVVPLIHR